MPLHAALAEGVALSHCLPKLQWLLTETACPRKYEQLLNVAAEAGDVATLRWHRTQGAVPRVVLFEHVKTMPVLQYHLEVDAIIDDEDACCDAARSSSLEVLQWCHAQGFPCDASAVGAVAAASGSLKKVQWMFNELKCSWSTEELTVMLQRAGANGRALPLCKWLRERGADWPAMLFHGDSYARWCAECVEWARGEGCTAPEYMPEVFNSDSDSDGGVGGDVGFDDADDAELAAVLIAAQQQL
jgi:hypothetical protein